MSGRQEGSGSIWRSAEELFRGLKCYPLRKILEMLWSSDVCVVPAGGGCIQLLCLSPVSQTDTILCCDLCSKCIERRGPSPNGVVILIKAQCNLYAANLFISALGLPDFTSQNIAFLEWESENVASAPLGSITLLLSYHHGLFGLM